MNTVLFIRNATLTLQVLPAGKKFEFYVVGETANRVAEMNLGNN